MSVVACTGELGIRPRVQGTVVLRTVRSRVLYGRFGRTCVHGRRFRDGGRVGDRARGADRARRCMGHGGPAGRGDPAARGAGDGGGAAVGATALGPPPVARRRASVRGRSRLHLARRVGAGHPGEHRGQVPHVPARVRDLESRPRRPEDGRAQQPIAGRHRECGVRASRACCATGPSRGHRERTGGSATRRCSRSRTRSGRSAARHSRRGSRAG